LRSAVVDAVCRVSSDMSSLLGLLVEFDVSGEWAFDGSASCAHWVADNAGVELCTVREWLRIGHALRSVDEIARRFADGRLSAEAFAAAPDARGHGQEVLSAFGKVRAPPAVAARRGQGDLVAVAHGAAQEHGHGVARGDRVGVRHAEIVEHDRKRAAGRRPAAVPTA